MLRLCVLLRVGFSSFRAVRFDDDAKATLVCVNLATFRLESVIIIAAPEQRAARVRESPAAGAAVHARSAVRKPQDAAC